jgi:hypothetical protein
VEVPAGISAVLHHAADWGSNGRKRLSEQEELDSAPVLDEDLPLEIHAGRCPPLKATGEPAADDELQPLILETVEV